MAVESNWRAQSDEIDSLNKSITKLVNVKGDLQNRLLHGSNSLADVKASLNSTKEQGGQTHGNASEQLAEQRELELQVALMKKERGEMARTVATAGKDLTTKNCQRKALEAEEAELRRRNQELIEAMKHMGEAESKQMAEAHGHTQRKSELSDIQQQLADSNRKLLRLADSQQVLESSGLAFEKQKSGVAETLKGIQVQSAEAKARIAAELQSDLERRQEQIKSLEDAMQSLVRLCVVAPTVNIHLANQPLNATPPPGVVVPSPESPAPEIRRLVEDDILASYTNIFLQKEEGGAPEQIGGKLEKWLETLLAEMQQTIQQKLKAFFKERKRAQREQYKEVAGLSQRRSVNTSKLKAGATIVGKLKTARSNR
jgi:hypothetical protein